MTLPKEAYQHTHILFTQKKYENNYQKKKWQIENQRTFPPPNVLWPTYTCIKGKNISIVYVRTKKIYFSRIRIQIVVLP